MSMVNRCILPCQHVHTISLTLLLLLARSSAAAMDKKLCSSLKGDWYNELGSKMTIETEKNGVLTGKYQTSVSSKPPLPPPSPLHGFVTTTNEKDPSAGPANALFSFNVAWKKFNSMSSFSGQCNVCNGQEILSTMWILTQRMDSSKDLWNAHNVGTDTFTRSPQSVVKCAEDPPMAAGRPKTKL